MVLEYDMVCGWKDMVEYEMIQMDDHSEDEYSDHAQLDIIYLLSMIGKMFIWSFYLTLYLTRFYCLRFEIVIERRRLNYHYIIILQLITITILIIGYLVNLHGREVISI